MIKNEYKFSPGQRLLLELDSELIEGEYDSGSKDRIDLINITDRYNNIQIKDKLSFYKNEIIGIRCLDETTESADDSTLLKPLTQKDNDRLAELTLNFIYINKPNDEYKQAISRLQDSESIGVVGLSGKPHEIDKIKILVISIPEQIYMFDILVGPGKSIPSELGKILSSYSIQKTVHNSRLLKASLWKCHTVEMNNIFDIQVADTMIYEKETGTKLAQMRNLSQCLLKRLNLQQSLLEQIQNVDSETWDKRPLDYFQVRQASFLATYLLTLKNYLHQIMLKSFHNSVNLSTNSLRNMTFYETRASAFSKKVPKELKNYIDNQEDIFM